MNPLQRASRNRKIAYIGAILALFTVSMVWRGVIPVPLGTSAARFAQPFRWAAAHTIQAQAGPEESGGLGLSDVDSTESEAEITGSAARLVLTGSRGFVVTGLWLSAIEKQKRNDFHEFEQRVQMVTKLQPNFITPWIFQSWNIAYNVSVEMHGSGDMYYYIVRGIQLLAEGERRNKRSPDMRYQIAFYYQNKFGVSDQVEVLRCLFDLSCIPPNDRNPANLINPATKEVNQEEFRKFCERHPHLVRRLRGDDSPTLDKKAREKLRAPRAEDVIQFLRDNKDVPNRYKGAGGDLKDPQDTTAFPILPAQFSTGSDEFTEAHPGSSTADDFAPGVGYFSAYKAARAWFSYSLLLLPPPLKDDEGNPVPGPTPRPGEFGHDPAKHRVPRLPMMILFRQGAPRAQSYQAELEQKEGWFDGEGWLINDAKWFHDPNYSTRPVPVLVGTNRDWSLDEWKRAASMWRNHGKAYGLILTDVQLTEMRRLASGAPVPSDPTQEQLADPNFRKRFFAASAMSFYAPNRSTTNFPYFLASAEAEANVFGGPQTVIARKTLWKAEQARKNGRKDEAIALYKQGLLLWKRVLELNPNFHRLPPPDRGDRGEEETYEFELAYQRLLVQDDQRVRDRANRVAHAAHAVIPFLTDPFLEATPQWPSANREEIKWFIVETATPKDFADVRDEEARKVVKPKETEAERAERIRLADEAERKRQDFSSPFTERMPSGDEWVRWHIKEGVRMRQGIARRQPTPAAPVTTPQGGGNLPQPPPPPPPPGQ